MSLHRALTRGAVLGVVALAGLSSAMLSPAMAQFPPPPAPPGAQSNPFPPPPGASGPSRPAVSAAPMQASPMQSPFAAPGGAPPQGPSGGCAAFVPLREAAEKDAGAIRAASERKATREEVCPLFQRFYTAEDKVLKFLEAHMSECNIPAEAVKSSKANHARTLKIRTAVCSAAPPAAGPSLSDALGASVVPEDETPKSGRGTFDTLTGPIKR